MKKENKKMSPSDAVHAAIVEMFPFGTDAAAIRQIANDLGREYTSYNYMWMMNDVETLSSSDAEKIYFKAIDVLKADYRGCFCE